MKTAHQEHVCEACHGIDGFHFPLCEAQAHDRSYAVKMAAFLAEEGELLPWNAPPIAVRVWSTTMSILALFPFGRDWE